MLITHLYLHSKYLYLGNPPFLTLSTRYNLVYCFSVIARFARVTMGNIAYGQLKDNANLDLMTIKHVLFCVYIAWYIVPLLWFDSLVIHPPMTNGKTL